MCSDIFLQKPRSPKPGPNSQFGVVWFLCRITSRADCIYPCRGDLWSSAKQNAFPSPLHVRVILSGAKRSQSFGERSVVKRESRRNRGATATMGSVIDFRYSICHSNIVWKGREHRLEIPHRPAVSCICSLAVRLASQTFDSSQATRSG